MSRAFMFAVWLAACASVAGQGAPDPPPQMAEQVFKNVQVLRGIPIDEFMDTMGMFAASLGYDCASCHAQGISSDRSAFAVATPSIQRARQMVLMMNAINQANFGGRPGVTCFTCHRGQIRPEIVPSLALQYGDLVDDPNAMAIAPDRRTSATDVLDTFERAVGGADRLAAFTSFVATGTYAGFNTGGGEVPLEVYASAPDRRTQVVRLKTGTGIKTFDGSRGWAAEGWRPIPLLPLTGSNLAGARLEAMLSFPGAIRQLFTQWQVGTATIDEKPVQVLQGRSGTALPVNFYFDQSGLLVRVLRWNTTAVGTVPTQVEYSDYREVAGVKVPFRSVITWTDGQNTIQFKDVRPNVAIEASRFARPAPYAPQ